MPKVSPSMHMAQDKLAIAHIDGDAFFASCEQAMNPALKGKPVVTGKERGIVSAASYEAKAMGIKRGVPLWEVKKLCPQAVIVSSDYESYSLFSKRMFAIMRRYTEAVEEYGIDEAFIDITGLRRPLKMSYSKIAYTIKQEIEAELNITVSVGLARSKALAKIASKLKKPSGFTVLHRDNTEGFLANTAVGDVWGIGKQTTHYVKQFSIVTAADFANKPQHWVERYFTKPHKELWRELNGESVWPVQTGERAPYKSISKMKTFTPPSSDKSYLFAQLVKNIENAFIKLRRHELVAKEFGVILRTQDFRHASLTAKLTRSTAFTHDVVGIAKAIFSQLYVKDTLYRATSVYVNHLSPQDSVQMNLFESPVEVEKLEQIYHSIDELSHKYGKHTIFNGATLPVHTTPDDRQRSRVSTQEHKLIRQVRGSRKYLSIPFLGLAH